MATASVAVEPESGIEAVDLYRLPLDPVDDIVS